MMVHQIFTRFEWYNADEAGMRAHDRGYSGLRDGTIFSNNFKLICPVQSRLQK
jgi:hypothetical protein